MNFSSKVAVCSRSFSKNEILRGELLARYAQVTFNDGGVQLKGDSLIKFLRGHEKAIVALESIDDAVLSKVPELRVISKYGVGLDMIDLPAMRAYGMALGWTGGVNRRSVTELVIAFAITMLRHVSEASRGVRAGEWRPYVGSLLTGKTVGIVGCGHVGKDLVPLLKAFDCTVLVNDILDVSDFCARHGAHTVGLDALLARSDVVTLHLPLDDSTRGILDEGRLAMLKPGAILINAARGGIVDELALRTALQDGRLAAAAFDVFASEPPADLDLIRLPNFLATPHIGGSAEEAILAMGRAAIAGLDDNAVP